MEIKTQQIVYGVAEVIAAHNLLRFVKGNTGEEKVRMAAGASMAGLGYVFGPELHERVKHLGDGELTQQMKQQLLYAAGGAVLGSVAGYKIGPRFRSATLLPGDIEDALEKATTAAADDPTKPGGLVTIASAGWLGYSLFFDGKNAEEQQRHLWGLGAGVVGYLYGPEMIRKVSKMLVPKAQADDAIELYARGSAIVGAVAGGLFGWHKGDAVLQQFRKEESDATTLP